MSADQLQYALLRFAQDKESANPGTGVAYVQALRDSAGAAFASGEASSIIDTTVNGERFTRTMNITATDMFIICVAVLDELSETAPSKIGMTFPTFQGGIPL